MWNLRVAFLELYVQGGSDESTTACRTQVLLKRSTVDLPRSSTPGWATLLFSDQPGGMHVVEVGRQTSDELSGTLSVTSPGAAESESLLTSSSAPARGEQVGKSDFEVSTSGDHDQPWYQQPKQECFRYSTCSFSLSPLLTSLLLSGPQVLQACAFGGAFVSSGYPQLQLYPGQHGFHWTFREA